MRRGRKKERGSVFIVSIVALMVLLILGAALMREAVNNLAAASKQERTYQALGLAEAGVDMALVKLYENYDNIQQTLESTGQYEGSFSAGDGSVAYTVYANYQGISDLVLIDSTGTTRTRQDARVRVAAKYLDQDSVDRVFRGAIFSDSPLTLNGAGNVLANAEGEGGDIYANGDITFNGTSYDMSPAGHIYTTGVTNWFPPEISGANVFEHIAPLPMPVIDLNYYRSIATQVFTGSRVFNSGNLNNLSGVIFVDGNVKISGQYSGSAVIVASGSIQVTGDVYASQPENDALVLMSPKYVKIAGNCKVEGLIYSHSVVDDGSVSISGSVEIVGAVVADAVVTNGAMNITYSDVWSGLPLPGKGKSQWAQISWERVGG
jgi:cytoskeletal protein CcmA (bactofilin family)/type II secretory pathway pseudopilin PulG